MENSKTSEILIYKTPKGKVSVDVVFSDETLKPLFYQFPELTDQNNNDLKIFGMVLHLERMSKDWQEEFKEDDEEGIQ